MTTMTTMTMTTITSGSSVRRALGLAAVLASSACASDPSGVGELEIRAWGEDFIEAGIPDDETSDGWAITFTRFEVSVRDIAIAGVAVPDPDPVDLALASAGAGHSLARIEAVDAGDYDDASFTIAS